MVGNPEAYAAFKVKLENLPENVVVIASHTQSDSRKEKVSFSLSLMLFLPAFHTSADRNYCCRTESNLIRLFQSHPGGLLFTKFGSNQTALLDLAFPVCPIK